jgi:hypothetical protein
MTGRRVSQFTNADTPSKFGNRFFLLIPTAVSCRCNIDFAAAGKRMTTKSKLSVVALLSTPARFEEDTRPAAGACRIVRDRHGLRNVDDGKSSLEIP